MMTLHGSALAGTVGLLFFMVLFAGAALYALWPSNKKTFDYMARLPLDDDKGDER